MQIGKGTRDFNSYVQNLQRALAVNSIGSQLTNSPDAPRIRRLMIHNPYRTTVAEMSICQFRIGTAQ